MMKNFFYHLCLRDLYLLDINGVNVLKKIRGISPGTKVIMMMAGVVNENMQNSIEKNACMFLTEPFDLLQVKMLTSRVLEEFA